MKKMVIEIIQTETGANCNLNNNGVEATAFTLAIADTILQLTGGHVTDGVGIAEQIVKNVMELSVRKIAEEVSDVEVK